MDVPVHVCNYTQVLCSQREQNKKVSILDISLHLHPHQQKKGKSYYKSEAWNGFKVCAKINRTMHDYTLEVSHHALPHSSSCSSKHKKNTHSNFLVSYWSCLFKTDAWKLKKHSLGLGRTFWPSLWRHKQGRHDPFPLVIGRTVTPHGCAPRSSNVN